jgi:lysophospholipase L1-like esterase
MRRLALLLLAVAFSLSLKLGIATEPAKLPRVVLHGDSIRMAYAPLVAKQLEGKAVIISFKANGNDSTNQLKTIKEWGIAEKPDVVHFNCGIHDTKKDKKTGKFQTSPEQYEKNLRQIVETLRKQTGATVIFALTTPIHDERAMKQREKAAYDLLDASTVEYNKIAERVMKELKVPINDLRSVCGDADERAKLIVPDGVHFTPAGSEKLAKAVAEVVEKNLPKGK